VGVREEAPMRGPRRGREAVAFSADSFLGANAVGHGWANGSHKCENVVTHERPVERLGGVCAGASRRGGGPVASKDGVGWGLREGGGEGTIRSKNVNASRRRAATMGQKNRGDEGGVLQPRHVIRLRLTAAGWSGSYREVRAIRPQERGEIHNRTMGEHETNFMGYQVGVVLEVW